MTAVTLELDTASARATLRGQIARLEHELAHTLATTFPPVGHPATAHHGGPRLLGLRELELNRDVLVDQVSDVRRRAQRQRAEQAVARAKLAAMRANPRAHPGERVTARELGQPGCTVYTVRRSLLSKWWRVKVSSGCP